MTSDKIRKAVTDIIKQLDPAEYLFVKNHIEALEDEIKKLRKQKTTYITTAPGRDGKIARLRADIETLTNQRNELADLRDSHIEEIRGLRERIEKLEAELKYNKEIIHGLKVMVGVAKEMPNEELREWLRNLELDLNGMCRDIVNNGEV